MERQRQREGPVDAEGGIGHRVGRCASGLELLAREAEGLLARIRAYPAVKVAPRRDGPGVVRTAEEALRGSAKQA